MGVVVQEPTPDDRMALELLPALTSIGRRSMTASRPCARRLVGGSGGSLLAASASRQASGAFGLRLTSRHAIECTDRHEPIATFASPH